MDLFKGPPENQPALPLFFPYALVQFLVRKGYDEAGLLKGTKITTAALRSPATRVSYHVHTKLINNAELAWDRPGLGLLFGGSLELYSLGMIGQAAASSRTLGEAMETIVRYLSLRSPLLSYRINRETSGTRFILAGTLDLGENERFMAEAAFAATSSFLTQLADQTVDNLRFDFSRSKHGSAELYRRTLGQNVRFDQPLDTLFIPTGLAALVLPSSNQISAAEARQYCDAEIERLGVALGFKQVVRTLLSSQMTAAPTESEAASILGYSTRSLRRRLRAQGTTFRALRRDVRFEAARKFLVTTHMSVEEIAFEVGFQNVGNFSRAFRQWAGQPPTAFRRSSSTVP